MIVKMIIDTGALYNEAAHKEVATNFRFIQNLDRFGVLVIPEESSYKIDLSLNKNIMTVFHHTISRLKPDARKLWQTFLMQYYKIGYLDQVFSIGPKGWNGSVFGTSEDDLRCLTGYVDLICIAEENASKLGFADSCVSRELNESNLELIRIEAVDLAKSINNVANISVKHIIHAKTINYVWKKYFEGLASNCKDITVVDRYATKGFTRHTWHKTGLWQLIKRLAEADWNGKLTIYSTHNEEGDEIGTLFLNNIKTISTKASIKIDLKLCPDRRWGEVMEHPGFQTISHDRFIRFGRFFCSIGVGLEILTGNSRTGKLFRGSSFHRKSISQSQEEIFIEQYLKRLIDNSKQGTVFHAQTIPS